MKRESNNEMDLILRKLGRESTTVPVMEGNGSPETAAEKHLDADELNAYAENALPLKTRARYTEHLADCTRCRQIVSQLNLASGVTMEEKTSVVPTLSGWKAFLSSLFSPMVLRYAVPAVLVLAVASIGLFVFRSMSQQAHRSAVAFSTDQKPPEPTSVLTDKSPGAGNKTNSSPEQVASTKTNGEREGATNAKGDVVDSKKAGEPKREQTETKATDQISAAAAPASANQPPPASMDSVTVQEQAVRNEEAAQRKTQPAAKPAESVAVTSADERRAKEPEKQTKESEKAAMPSVGGYAGSPTGGLSKLKNAPRAAGDRASEQDKPINGRDREDKDNSEIRSIAGRRFRKEGSTWVDTAFDSSRRTVNLTRGSEQYRALVADEPEIKTIADQLSGEVIVMWKGTAYRIR